MAKPKVSSGLEAAIRAEIEKHLESSRAAEQIGRPRPLLTKALALTNLVDDIYESVNHLTRRKDGKAAQPQFSTIEAKGGDRRSDVDAYIQEVFLKTGRRITRTIIWKEAGYTSRAEFERWESGWYERHGGKPNKTASRRFNDLLTRKPHLNETPSLK